MFWRTIRGWSHGDVEPSLSLVSGTTQFMAMCSFFLPHSTAPPSATVAVSICILPEELSSKWAKEPLGNQMVTTVASLLESGNSWQCKSLFNLLESHANSKTGNVPGVSNGAIVTVSCRTTHLLVSSMWWFICIWLNMYFRFYQMSMTA